MGIVQGMPRRPWIPGSVCGCPADLLPAARDRAVYGRERFACEKPWPSFPSFSSKMGPPLRADVGC